MDLLKAALRGTHTTTVSLGGGLSVRLKGQPRYDTIKGLVALARRQKGTIKARLRTQKGETTLSMTPEQLAQAIADTK